MFSFQKGMNCMQLILPVALGVGGATVLGALLGFAFKNISDKTGDTILAFAAGVMLAAAIIGLILPSLSYGSAFMSVTGIFCGAVFLLLLDRLVPHLYRIAGVDVGRSVGADNRIDKILLFVLAIAVHNLPEGLAAGVAFGGESISDAITVALAIALQNLPEGMVIIAPMLQAGISVPRTFMIALSTGIVEIFGTLLGFFAVSLSQAILPFFLAFAGGTMIYVISDEMIPETHAGECCKKSSFSLLCGFCLMLIIDFYLP